MKKYINREINGNSLNIEGGIYSKGQYTKPSEFRSRKFKNLIIVTQNTKKKTEKLLHSNPNRYSK